MLPAALATASRCQPRALRYWRRAAAHRSPGRPGLTRRPSDVQPGNVVPTRSHGADYRSRSISWVFALSKMSLKLLRDATRLFERLNMPLWFVTVVDPVRECAEDELDCTTLSGIQ